jgi:hypothetical protein
MRGSIHVHGMARLKSDPDLTSLGKEVVTGRTAYRIKSLLDNNLQSYQQKFPNDILCSRPISEIQGHDLTDERLDELIQSGRQAEKKIMSYYDYLFTCVNPSDELPADAHSESAGARPTPNLLPVIIGDIAKHQHCQSRGSLLSASKYSHAP